jgi:hypothetical protein
MSSDTQVLRRLRTSASTQATPKRVRQPVTFYQFGSWWDLRYPTRAK